MRLLVLAFVVCAACKGQDSSASKGQVGAVTEAEAKAFADKLSPLVKPCEPAKLEPLIDSNALAARFLSHTSLPGADRLAADIAKRPIGALILCRAMTGIDEYKLLHIVVRDGSTRAVMRRLITNKANGDTIAGYDELALGKSRDGVVRIVDSYSYVQGQWISEVIGGNRDALAQSVDYLGDIPEMADTIKKAQQFHRQGLNKEAIEIIDSLPKAAHEYRGVQMLRVRAAFGIGPEAYKQALDELATVFHDDVSVAMVETNGALARSDYDAAIKWINILDTALGGDAFQTANRGFAYLRRGKPGDIELARKEVDKAIAMEPTLKRPYEIKLDIAIADKKWAEATQMMTVLEDKYGVVFDDEKLAAQPAVVPLLESAEFKEWRAGRKR
jgi:hypothetical protein